MHYYAGDGCFGASVASSKSAATPGHDPNLARMRFSDLISNYYAFARVDGALMDRLRKSLAKHCTTACLLSELRSCKIAPSRAAVRSVLGLRITAMCLAALQHLTSGSIIWFGGFQTAMACPIQPRLPTRQARPCYRHTLLMQDITYLNVADIHFYIATTRPSALSAMAAAAAFYHHLQCLSTSYQLAPVIPHYSTTMH